MSLFDRFRSGDRSSSEKAWKQIDRLRSKGKLSQAADQLAQYCEDNPSELRGWTALATLASELKRQDVALRARFTAAKLSNADVETWVELAQQAESASQEQQHVEALFRAADAASTEGDARTALTLCDEVLALAPGHRPALHIKKLVARSRRQPRKGKRRKSSPWDPWDEESTLTFLNQEDGVAQAARQLEVAMAVTDDDGEPLLEELTGTDWFPAEPDLGTESRPTKARFVSAAQHWPTVLDSRGLLFVGEIEDLDPEILALGEEINLGAGAQVTIQGNKGQLLYLIDAGTVSASRERDVTEDLGVIQAGSFFGEVGAIAGLPCTTTMVTEEPARLRVISRKKLDSQLEAATVSKLVAALKGWYLELMVSTCPLFVDCSDEELHQLTSGARWTTFKAGDLLAEQDQFGGLLAIVVGAARVTRDGPNGFETLGYATTGDLVGEIDPSPVTVNAEGTLFAVGLRRAQLPDVCLEALQRRVHSCEEALAAAGQACGG